MTTIILQPGRRERDFGELAALFSLEQEEPMSEPGLQVDYEVHEARIFRLMVAQDERGDLLGFNWATRSRFDGDEAYFYVIVKPEHRGQGAGRRLYKDVEQAARRAGIRRLQVSVRDACPEFRAFAERRGFVVQSHYLGLVLDLAAFGDRPYDAIIAGLEGEGFRFTSMEALGNTEEAQRRLYVLNDTTAMETIVPEDEHSWLSFEDFQRTVCRVDWYKPGGQLIAIDTATGDWAAMSAITRYEGSDYASNLHTGVDRRYHGRKLAQAILVLALRYARDVLHVCRVQSDENAECAPALAVYHELGYEQVSGVYAMEKTLDTPA